MGRASGVVFHQGQQVSEELNAGISLRIGTNPVLLLGGARCRAGGWPGSCHVNPRAAGMSRLLLTALLGVFLTQRGSWRQEAEGCVCRVWLPVLSLPFQGHLHGSGPRGGAAGAGHFPTAFLPALSLGAVHLSSSWMLLLSLSLLLCPRALNACLFYPLISAPGLSRRCPCCLQVGAPEPTSLPPWVLPGRNFLPSAALASCWCHKPGEEAEVPPPRALLALQRSRDTSPAPPQWDRTGPPAPSLLPPGARQARAGN